MYPGFQNNITALQLQGYNISYKRHTTALIQYKAEDTYLSTDYNQMPSGKEKNIDPHKHTGPGPPTGSTYLVVVESPRETSITIPVVDHTPEKSLGVVS